MYVHMCTYVYTCMCMYLHVYVYLYACISVCVYVSINRYVHICIWIYMYRCLYTDIQISTAGTSSRSQRGTTQGGRARARARVGGRASSRPDHSSPTPHTASSACCSSAGGTPHRRSALTSYTSVHTLHMYYMMHRRLQCAVPVLVAHTTDALAVPRAVGNSASSYKCQRGMQGTYVRGGHIAHATRAHPLPAKCHKVQLVLSLDHPHTLKSAFKFAVM